MRKYLRISPYNSNLFHIQYMTLQLLHSEFPYIWRKFDFFFISVLAHRQERLAFLAFRRVSSNFCPICISLGHWLEAHCLTGGQAALWFCCPFGPPHPEVSSYKVNVILTICVFAYTDIGVPAKVSHCIKGLLHRIGKVLSFSPVVGIGTPPTPNSPASVPSPKTRGWGGKLACGWGVGGVPIPTTGEKA
jgi:hypothetical protein